MKLYSELAEWWPLLSPPEEYEQEAGLYAAALEAASDVPPSLVLELGSGGGNNASYLKTRYHMVLVDLSPGMLAVSRALNPECEHVVGDMRTVRLQRQFDAVFVHDAICYMTRETDLRKVMETAFAHCKPRGVVLMAPDFVRENFRAGADHGGSDNATHGLRYLEWVWDPDPADTTYTVDYAYLLRTPDGTTRAVHDRHIEGLFARADWLRLLGEVGFEAPRVMPGDHSEIDYDYEMFVARKPANAANLQE